MTPKLSIIVPVFNTEKYLVRCVNSIINQTFQDYELILINDGSTDSSGIICDELSKTHAFIKVVHQKNGGVGCARNAGILIAKGEYIGFVDSDDWISRDMYEVLMDTAKKFNSDIVSCSFKKVFDFSEKIFKKIEKGIFRTIPYSNINSIEALYKHESLNWVVVDKIYKRSFFLNVRFESMVVLEDVLILPQLLIHVVV